MLHLNSTIEEGEPKDEFGFKRLTFLEEVVMHLKKAVLVQNQNQKAEWCFPKHHDLW